MRKKHPTLSIQFVFKTSHPFHPISWWTLVILFQMSVESAQGISVEIRKNYT